jgi:hypothetical protein
MRTIKNEELSALEREVVAPPFADWATVGRAGEATAGDTDLSAL